MTADDPGPAPGGVPPDPLADIGAISATDAAFDRIAAGERTAYDDPALRLFAGLARDIHTTPPPAAWRPGPSAEPDRPLRRRAVRAGRRAVLAGVGAAAASVLCAVGVAAATGVDPVATVTNGRVRLAPVHTVSPAPDHHGLPGGPLPTSPTAPPDPSSPASPRTPATAHHGAGRTHSPSDGHAAGHSGHRAHNGHGVHRPHGGHPGKEPGHGGAGRHLDRTPPAHAPGRDTPTAASTDPDTPPATGNTRPAGPPARTRPHTCGPACDAHGHGHSGGHHP